MGVNWNKYQKGRGGVGGVIGYDLVVFGYYFYQFGNSVLFVEKEMSTN